MSNFLSYYLGGGLSGNGFNRLSFYDGAMPKALWRTFLRPCFVLNTMSIIFNNLNIIYVSSEIRRPCQPYYFPVRLIIL
ncbi:hypothetical protein M758_5G031600 [Ceratodon purpureus]|nr:hypothetical protein M758_5G031600 [Ceratodon purpureus]